MQRCPYIHEMKERLLGEQVPMEIVPTKAIPTPPPFIMDQQHLLHQQPVATIVKLNPDGFSSHTSPTHHRVVDRTPLMAKESEDEFHYVHQKIYPKNAKTSLFIIMSFVYAKLLVVICVAYVISDVVTHNIPLYYYEGFFTYLYGMSILFLLYVFCFLLQESSCCAGNENKAVKPPPKQKVKEKEREKEKEKEKEKKKEEEQKKKEEKVRQKKEKKDKEKDKKNKKQEKRERFPRKMRDLVQQQAVSPTSQAQQQGGQGQPAPAQAPPAQGQPPPPPPPVNNSAVPASGGDAEAGIATASATVPVKNKCKRKTTQNDHSHGSFFLRIGAIAFGLGTMIYNGLEFGVFFEVPFTSPCYMILRGVNPVLQMIFTFMQMYFIFMNSRLNIHRFKVIARFGLMHVVATNICVWIRTLVIEYLKEITNYHMRMFNATLPSDVPPLAESIRLHNLRNANTILGTHKAVPDVIKSTTSHIATVTSTMPSTFRNFFQTTTSTIATTLDTVGTTLRPTATSSPFAEETELTQELGKVLTNNGTELIDDIIPQAFRAFSFNETSNNTDQCGRVNIMGSIVQDSSPYLYPFIIEFSLIGAAVIYVMWKHIGRNPRYVTQEDLEHRLEAMLSRRAVALAQAQQQGRVDCAGASKGLFFGLLVLVASLICLILFFVLVHHRDFGLLAIYLADVSHCTLMVLSIIAIIVGFFRVQSLKFKTEDTSDLNDILLRVSAFGLFLYAVFSVIAGHLNAFTREPNLLVMVTGTLSVIQVVLQLLFIADVSRRRVHLPEHDRSKPGRQVVTFLLICNVTMWIIYTFEMQKVEANPVQLEFYGFLAWAIVQRFTLPLCIFHRFHSAVTLAEIWKTSYKARLE